MAIGLVGRKAGMTRIFTDEGQSVPVTVIEVEGNRVTQVRTDDADGYRAVQVTTGARRASRGAPQWWTPGAPQKGFGAKRLSQS